jgi:hypothetical protein
LFKFVAGLDCDFHAGLPAEVGTSRGIADRDARLSLASFFENFF